MATLSQLSYDIKNTGVTVTVPDNDVARLMYYLHCVTIGVGLDILQDDLVDYKNYWRLTAARTDVVFKAVLEYSPDEFIDKVIFLDNEGEIVTGSSTNKFCTISAACDIISLQSDIIIAGQVRNAANVMFYKDAWLDRYYKQPIARNKTRIARVIGSLHCIHCKGTDGMCACSDCPRSASSKCVSMLDLFDALTGALSTPAATPTPAPAPAPAPKAVPDNQHNSTCDGCKWDYIRGTRYKCSICYDYDLCKNCYTSKVHDLSHPFLQIDKPGSTAVNLPPRATPTPAPAPRAPPAPSPGLRAPAAQPRVPSPAPRPTPPPAPATKPASVWEQPPPYTPEDATQNDSTFFYNDMTAAELKAFLNERGVSYDGILDKETLCRLVWETHCDCMSMSELNGFLAENNISTVGCRDIASRRQKAKDAFQVSRPAQPAPRIVRFYENDTVSLSGLSRADMNGKYATIINPDVGGGRAEVHITEMGKTFKVKFENLTTVVTEHHIEEEDLLD